jgi:predicted SAM-dependent methyltransferase
MRSDVYVKGLVPTGVYRSFRTAYRGVDYVRRNVFIREYQRCMAAVKGVALECPVCGNRAGRFLPLNHQRPPCTGPAGTDRNMNNAMIFEAETMNVEQHFCPTCRAMDRDRLYALFIAGELKKTPASDPLSILDIAPSRPLRRFLRKTGRFNYRSADYVNDGVDDQVDIQSMPIYPDAKFDCLLCSHVLEHVPDDRKAMRELRRILKPGGWGIVMAPIILTLENTVEDPTVSDPQERLRRFGQEDHLRLYSKADFVARLQEAGFAVRQLDRQSFEPGTFERSGISPGSVLYVVG